MDNQRKLYLVPGYSDNPVGNYVTYDLMTYDCHYDNFKEFYLIATEVIEQLFTACVTLSGCYFDRKKASKKRWLLPDKPAIFFPNPDVDKMKDYISSHQPGWSSCCMEYTEKSGCFKYDRKLFFVSAQKINQLFIKKNFNDFTGIVLIGYLPEYFERTDSIEFMAKDFIGEGQCKTSHYAISIDMDNSHSKLGIMLNPMQYHVSQLIDRIRTVAEKYNNRREQNRAIKTSE